MSNDKVRSHNRKKFWVRVTYKTGHKELVPMLTQDLYKFITRFNKHYSDVESFKVERDKS